MQGREREVEQVATATVRYWLTERVCDEKARVARSIEHTEEARAVCGSYCHGFNATTHTC